MVFCLGEEWGEAIRQFESELIASRNWLQRYANFLVPAPLLITDGLVELRTAATENPFEWEEPLRPGSNVQSTTGYTPFYPILPDVWRSNTSRLRSWTDRKNSTPYAQDDLVWVHSKVIPRGASTRPWIDRNPQTALFIDCRTHVYLTLIDLNDVLQP